ncbi:hypothetical protein Vretimale_18227 [Volvox reticuliferus]|nr:hypothetical protein Vretifemale_17998 [Volvox reticuliferus]GIM15451.1 hypothetical protein Vretimale_18227 [Volvox reticuliferus]
MRITLGPHAGLACTALEVLPTKGDAKQHERWLVRLAASQEMVVVQVSELGEKWERAKAVDKSEKDAGGGDDGGDGGGGGGGQPESSRGAGGGRDREDRRSDRDHDRSHDRQYDRDKDSGRQRGREREEWGWADDGGGGKRKSREEDDERRPVDDQDGGRGGSKRSRVSEPYQSKGGSGGMRGDDRQYDSRYDNDNDDAKKDSRDHHKHGKKEKHKNDKRDKKDKKKKKEKKEHEKDLNRNRDHRSGGGWSDRDRARERDASYSRSEEGDDSEEMVEEEKAVEKGTAAGGRPTWLFPAIKVRIVDKSVRGGKLYLKKGTVVDVHPGGTADVAVDDTGDVLRLPESSLETVVPRHEGAAVLVVAGPHRGARGRLLQASTATGAAAVQLAADFSIVRLMLDDVAGFVGELDEE